MTIEASQFISQLNTSFPRSTDLLKEGDDHIRLIKANLKNTFPNILTSVSISSDTLNYLNNSIQASSGGITFRNSVNTNSGVTIDLSKAAVKLSTVSTIPNDADAISWGTLKAMFKALYPVGSIYIMGTNPANPASLPMFSGTTWERYGRGRYMLSAGADGDNGPWGSGLGSAGSTGFSIGYGNMPQHTHGVSVSGTLNGSTGSMNRNWAHYHGGGFRVPNDWGDANFTTVDGYGGNGRAIALGDGHYTTGMWRTTTVDTNHEHSASVSGTLSGGTGGVSEGSGTNPINYQPAFTSMYVWRRTA